MFLGWYEELKKRLEKERNRFMSQNSWLFAVAILDGKNFRTQFSRP